MDYKTQYYLRIGKAPDLKNPKERRIYRFFEMVPGLLAWITLFSVILLSWLKPVWIAIFIITFDVYWLLKTIYFSVHLRASYRKMRGQMKFDWLGKVKSLKEKKWRDIYHLIIFPLYMVPFEVLDEAVGAILKNDYPKDRMIIAIAIEERVGEPVQEVASRIKEKYENEFFKFIITVHPKDIPGEIQGKGPNETWSARKVKEKIIDPLGIPYKDIVVSCFDEDTRAYPKYFSCLTYHYLTVEKPLRTGYQPIPIYNNNIWDAPSISRVVATSATFWQMIQQQRPERLSEFSSHSVSFQMLVDVDYWQVNMVSEDSRIFWQGLLYYNGDYRAIPLNYPVSMEANVASSLWKTAKNVYKQQRRWGWGSENVPYLFFGFLKNKKIPFKTKFHWIWVQLEGFWSWSTNALLIFLLGWLPLYLGGESFNETLLSYNLPRMTRFLMTLAMVGLIGSAIYSTLLLPPAPARYKGIKKTIKYLSMIIQWILVPFSILVFGCLPGLEAQTRLMLGKYMGFWGTPKGQK